MIVPIHNVRLFFYYKCQQQVSWTNGYLLLFAILNYLVKKFAENIDWQILKILSHWVLEKELAIGSLTWAQNRFNITDAYIKPAF
jgi:hypothetical protein